MEMQSLNGKWLYRVGKGKETEKDVPFSAICVGHSECRKIFDLDVISKQTLLKFDGITYYAKVTLNGEYLGDMVPYSEYVFDVTGAIKEKNNELLVQIEDISPVFGPTAGWQNYGGIIRNVTLLFSKSAYIKDVFFYTELKNDYNDAVYNVETTLSAPVNGKISYTLTYNGEVADRFESDANVQIVQKEIKNVKLWSTDEPNLYKLTVTLEADGKLLDCYECNVGFREIKCNRHRFVINGKEVFLQGVCKHEMIGGYGHTVPDELIEEDLRAIKATGCNFVRLVHYPHSRSTLDIADRIGLLVSEEPGLWWSRTEVEQVSAGSLEVLKRTVLRDRNHPCIAFWLCFNECRFTEQFLIDSARTCRKYDKSRMVSGANCMNDDDTLKYFNICGFDFYTMHPYSDTPERGLNSAKKLYDKPLLFTEWGGYHIYDNPNLIKSFIESFYALYTQNSDEGALAGAFLWYWREVNDYGRAGKACVDGVLKEALVYADGTPTMIYEPFCAAWRDVKQKKRYAEQYYYEQIGGVKGSALPYLKGGADYSIALEKAKESEWEKSKFNGMRYRRITLGPVLQNEEVNGVSKIPYMLSDGTELVFDGKGSATSITLLGAVSMSKGYPISGEYGEAVAKVVLKYSDGKEKEIMLCNGVEITTVYTTLGSSCIDPIGEKAVPFARFGYEKTFENYIINTITMPNDQAVDQIKLISADNGYDVLIFGVFA